MLYAIKIFDVENSGPLRDIHRDAHLAYVKEFDAQTIFSGPFLTHDLQSELGSHRLSEFADKAAVESHLADEPYITGGVQDGYTIHGWWPDNHRTWRDCNRTEGNVQFLVEAFLKPGVGAVPEGIGLARNTYLQDNEAKTITSGWLLAEDEAPCGTLMILDAPDLAAAQSLWANEPLLEADLYGEVNFYGWRFGRVFDRFKVDPN